MKPTISVLIVATALLLAGCSSSGTASSGTAKADGSASNPPASATQSTSNSTRTSSPPSGSQAAPVSAVNLPSTTQATTTVEGLANDFILAITQGNVRMFCSLRANSPFNTNPGEAPNKPYSAANLATCESGVMLDATPGSRSTAHVGRVVTQGNEALVSIVGKICGSDGCKGDDDPDLGLPPKSGTFAHLYEGFATGGFDSASDAAAAGDVIACEQIGGNWYVSDDDSDS